MDATIVSMSDITGRTGNVDYNDCRVPSDIDLVRAAKKFNFTKNIKFTITYVVGTKTKFTADIRKGKLVKTSDTITDNKCLKEIVMTICEQELAKILQFKNSKAATVVMQELNISEDDIWDIVEKKRKGLWFGVPEKYMPEMFNCALAEYIVDTQHVF